MRKPDLLILGKECRNAPFKEKYHKLFYKGRVYYMEHGSDEWVEIQLMKMKYGNLITLHLDEVLEVGGEKWNLI